MISRTTQNKAKRVGLGIEERNDEEATLIEICELEDDGALADEPLVVYRSNSDGSFGFVGTCYISGEDMPAHIRNEQHLRDLLPDFAKLV